MYCYRFPDEATWLGAAFAEGLIVDGDLQAYTHDHAIDVVGVILAPAHYDDGQTQFDYSITLPGFHVNVLGIAPEAWDEYLVVVNTPSRIFAGGDGPVPGDDILNEIVDP